MASLLTTSVSLPPRLTSTQLSMNGQKLMILKSQRRSSKISHCSKTPISRSAAEPETLKLVQTTIAKQLSIHETAVAPTTKFAHLGVDSLDIVEILMELEEQFGVSIGDNGAENISTVQDVADLIQKVKAADAS